VSVITLEEFLNQLASSEPTPGGGGAAAVMGAMGAGLLSMVARLTIGKQGYEGSNQEMETQLRDTEALRYQFYGLVDRDAQAFGRLMAAYRLPRESFAQTEARTSAIQLALEEATRVPLICAEACASGIRLAVQSASMGNRNVITDTGAGVLAFQAALRASALNIMINVPHIRAREFSEGANITIESLLSEYIPMSEQVMKKVELRLS
jgi:formiminotetrahydrofolate cyclodeaminase